MSYMFYLLDVLNKAIEAGWDYFDAKVGMNYS